MERNQELEKRPPAEEEKEVQDITSADGDSFDISVGSRLKVNVVKLNGAQSRRASFMARAGDEMDNARCRALYAIRNINGEIVPVPKSDADLDRVASRFDAVEFDAFLVLYGEVTSDPKIEEQVKKSLGRRGLL